jgi:hypothetical protein
MRGVAKAERLKTLVEEDLSNKAETTEAIS